MGLVVTLWRIDSLNFDKMTTEKKQPSGFENGSAYIDKSWEVLAYLLVGDLRTNRGNILYNVIFPSGHFVIDPGFETYEAINYSSPEKVKEINIAFQQVTPDIFRQLFESMDLNKSNPYPGHWTKSEEDFQYLEANFMTIKRFYVEAAENNEYVAVSLG